MRQLVINIPDDKYHAFIDYVKSNFTEIQIKENKIYREFITDDSTLEIMLLAERSLAEDWLSDEDKRWDNHY
jgi:hypothetical protein